MRCREGVLLVALLTACASAPRPIPEEGQAAPAPREQVEAGGVPGTFPLPQALAQDPAAVPIPPLDFEVLEPQKVVLPTGLTLYLRADRTVPLVTVQALVFAGSVDEPAERLGTAALTFDLMPSAGAGALDADALDELLEFRAANVGGGAGDELSSLSINLRTEDVDALLPVFKDMLLRPRFQKDRFEVAVSRYVESVRRREDNPAGLASRALAKAVFGPQSAFGREATEATLRRIRAADLEAFRKRFVTPASTSLVVTGDFVPEQMRARLEALFSDWKAPARPARTWAPAQPLSRRVIFVPKDVAQVKVRMGGYGYERLSPLEFPARVMSTALGGGLGAGRLYREIRDRLGLAYSAYASASPGPVTGMFVVGLDTRPESAVGAIEATLGILEDVSGRRPLSAEEVQRAADMYLNSFVFRFDTPEKIAREKAVYDVFGYPADYLETFRQHIEAVDPSAVHAAAERLLQEDGLQIVVVGPEGKVGDLSRFGPVTVIRDVEAFR